MTRAERKEALRDLWRKARMLFALMRAVWSGQVISMDVELRGSVLLDNSIMRFSALPYFYRRMNIPPLVDYHLDFEPSEDEDGPFAFAVTHMDSIEILQIDETYTPEDDE